VSAALPEDAIREAVLAEVLTEAHIADVPAADLPAALLDGLREQGWELTRDETGATS
jgi:hypothetical protein